MTVHQEASTGAIVQDAPSQQAKEINPKDLVMHVKIYSPYKIYFDDEATSVSAENDTGPFDILPHHHNFMTLLNSSEILIRTKRDQERIKIARGIMHVKADSVTVFLDV